MGKETKETAVVKSNSQALAVPDFIKNATVGGSSLDTEDMVIPRLKIIQKLDPVFESDPALGGCFYNNLTGESYGKEVEVVVLVATSGILLFGKKGTPDEGKILARKFKGSIFPSLNPEKITDDMIQWTKGEDGEPDEKPEANKVFTYILIANGKDMLQFSAMGTGLKPGKKLNTLLGKGALHVKKFRLSTTWVDAGPQKKYYTFEVAPAGMMTADDEPTFRMAENLLVNISGKTIAHETDEKSNKDNGDEKPF